jgi:hypothetical protein
VCVNKIINIVKILMTISGKLLRYYNTKGWLECYINEDSKKNDIGEVNINSLNGCPFLWGTKDCTESSIDFMLHHDVIRDVTEENLKHALNWLNNADSLPDSSL